MPRDIWQESIDRRRFLKGGIGVTLGGTAALLAACGGTTSNTGQAATTPTPNFPKAQIDGDLNLFNWSQYMSPDVISGFAKNYGIKVNTPYFDNMQDMMAKLNAGVPYDLTFPTMDFADQLIKANMLMPIDHSQLANWNEVPAYFKNPWYDPKALHSVPYAIWTTGIVWRTDQVQGLTGSWSDFWNLASTYSHKFNLLDDFQETLGMSLLRLHKNVNSKSRSDLDKAVSELLKIKPNVNQFTTDDITPMVNGTVAMHHAWSGDVYQILSQVNNPQVFKYETCKEGVPTGNDTMVIPKNAQHPGTAMKFIDWMLAPENATTNVKYFGYPQVTTTGISVYNSNVASQYPYLAMTLDQAVRGLREIVPVGANLQLWNEEWTKVKAG